MKWSWTEAHESAFNRVKLIKTEFLHHPTADERFYLQTDESDVAIGAHLLQVNNYGEKSVIGIVGEL